MSQERYSIQYSTIKTNLEIWVIYLEIASIKVTIRNFLKEKVTIGNIFEKVTIRNLFVWKSKDGNFFVRKSKYS